MIEVYKKTDEAYSIDEGRALFLMTYDSKNPVYLRVPIKPDDKTCTLYNYINLTQDNIDPTCKTDYYHFDVENESYRIKKTSKYRPFKNAKECFEEMKKHQPFGWLKVKDIEQYYSISIVYSTENYNRYYNLFSNCTFADGQPFGIKE